MKIPAGSTAKIQLRDRVFERQRDLSQSLAYTFMILGLNFEVVGIPVLLGRIPIKGIPCPDCDFIVRHVYSHLMAVDQLRYVAPRGSGQTELCMRQECLRCPIPVRTAPF